MLLKKNETLVELLNNIKKESKTPEYSTADIKRIAFFKGKGILFEFYTKIDSIFYKDTSIDFDVETAEPAIISLISKLFKTSDEIKIETDYETILINDKFRIKSSGIEQNDDASDLETFISFTKEQFEALEGDFKFSQNIYFQLPKALDTIVFVVYQGKLWKLVPGATIARKIMKFDATVNEALLAQRFGFADFAFVFPKHIFDFVKGSEVSISFNKTTCCVSTDKLEIRFSLVDFGTKTFKEKLNYFSTAEKIATAKQFKDIVEKIFVDNDFEEALGNSVKIKIVDNVMTVEAGDNGYLTYKEEVDFPDIEMELLDSIKYCLDDFTDDKYFFWDKEHSEAGVINNKEQTCFYCFHDEEDN